MCVLCSYEHVMSVCCLHMNMPCLFTWHVHMTCCCGDSDMACYMFRCYQSIHQSLPSTLKQRQQVGDSRGESKNPKTNFHCMWWNPVILCTRELLHSVFYELNHIEILELLHSVVFEFSCTELLELLHSVFHEFSYIELLRSVFLCNWIHRMQWLNSMNCMQ